MVVWRVYLRVSTTLGSTSACLARDDMENFTTRVLNLAKLLVRELRSDVYWLG